MTKVARRCVDCPRLTVAGASRCPSCAQAEQLRRNAQRGGWSWPIIKAQVLDRDGRRCQAERYPLAVDVNDHEGPLEIDHIVPLAHGGTNDPINLRTLCKKHHAEKTARERRRRRERRTA